MQVRARAAAGSRDTLRQHFEHAVEIATIERAVGPGAADKIEEFVFTELFASAGGDHLLRENVERVARNLQAVERAVVDGAHQRGALDQFIASGGE